VSPGLSQGGFYSYDSNRPGLLVSILCKRCSPFLRRYDELPRVGYFVILAASIHPDGETCLRLAVATYFLIEASRQVLRKREMILGAKLCSRRSKHFPPIVGHHDRSLECAAGDVY